MSYFLEMLCRGKKLILDQRGKKCSKTNHKNLSSLARKLMKLSLISRILLKKTMISLYRNKCATSAEVAAIFKNAISLALPYTKATPLKDMGAKLCTSSPYFLKACYRVKCWLHRLISEYNRTRFIFEPGNRVYPASRIHYRAN